MDVPLFYPSPTQPVTSVVAAMPPRCPRPTPGRYPGGFSLPLVIALGEEGRRAGSTLRSQLVYRSVLGPPTSIKDDPSPSTDLTDDKRYRGTRQDVAGVGVPDLGIRTSTRRSNSHRGPGTIPIRPRSGARLFSPGDSGPDWGCLRGLRRTPESQVQPVDVERGVEGRGYVSHNYPLVRLGIPRD